MSRTRQRQQGKSAAELAEEAAQLLRTAPAATLASYYLGTLPFILGLLYFWADMSRSPFASQHLAEAALGLAALFVWMKFWQGVFIGRLRAAIAGTSPPPLNFARCRRLLFVQAALPATGLFVAPLALAFIFPSAWVIAFYQNVAVLAEEESSGLFPLIKRAIRQAVLWPRQNHFVLGILAGFGLYVFLNWATVCFVLPRLIKMLFGVESVFTRSGLSLLNTTFFATMAGLTFLCVDPILKAVYTLRCFYGQSLGSGADLRGEMRRARSGLGLAVLMMFGLVTGVAAQDASMPSPPPGDGPVRQEVKPTAAAPVAVSAPALDHAIEKALKQPQYAWRSPREKAVDSGQEDGIVRRFLTSVWRVVKQGLESFFNWLGRWLSRFFRSGGSSSSGSTWMVLLEIILYGLLMVAVGALAFLAYRAWQGRRRGPGLVLSMPIQPAPDLADENVAADQLPEDGWMKLARELWERDELRLALRAFYLASLAHLAGRNLIRIARFKSNRDYERELQRRGHSFPELLAVFGENVSTFDRIWYGLHDVNSEIVGRFAENVGRMTRGVGR
jgi:hypothetical protein